MNNRLTKISMAAGLLFGATAYSATGLTPNLVRDGGMEQWRKVSPGTDDYERFKEIESSHTDQGDKLMPSAFEQGQVSVAKMETAAVSSGKRALRLKASSFYMHYAFDGAYATQRGDTYVVRFMAKGKGKVEMRLPVYRDRKHVGYAYMLEQKGTPVPDKWTPIEQRMLVGQESPTKVYPGLNTFGNEMLIDDVFVGRVLLENERSEAKKVPKEHDVRVAFASAAARAPAIDGRLEEECWKAAVPFSGFRLSHEQTLLAPQQASFRVLYDEAAIYLGLELTLPDAQRTLDDLRASPPEEDRTGDVYTDRHSVEVFIQPPGQARYVQYVVSLNGCRYDGIGMEKSWSGQWKQAVSAGDDRWFLEMMIPAADLELDRIPAAEGWRLNVVDNKDGNYSIWAAVGNNFHTPFNFGALVTKEFAQWRAEKLRGWDAMRKKAASGAEKYGLAFADRLERTARFARTLSTATGGGELNWEQITRTYALINSVDAVYRVMDAEMRYARFFSGQ